jgi:ABC-2 type transport system ATP-binding protein
MDNNDLAIKVDHLSKDFKLPHEKTSSIKSAFINFYRRNRNYEMQHALKDISFEVKEGEFFAIVGRNGSGKSTMLKLLAGIYVPNNGSVTVNGRLTPFIELGVGFNMELTGRENVYLNGALLGFSRKEMQAMYKDIVEFAELERFMDQKLKNYSSGMQVRLAFSIAIRAESDILLIDEVLAVGDADFQRKSLSYFKQLKKNKKTVVFVSHDMTAVKEFCDRGILIENGNLTFEGDSNQLAKEYALMFENANKEVKKTYTSKDPDKRAGSGEVRITRAKATASADEIVIHSKAIVHKDVDELMYGIHVAGMDGVDITSMGNRMINQPDLKHLKAGSQIEFMWKIQNVFRSGDYSITLTLTDGSHSSIDYFVDAAHFTSKKDEESNTAVLPPVSVTHKLD